MFVKTTPLEATVLAFYDAWISAKVPLTDDQFTWAPGAGGAEPELACWGVPARAGKRLLRVCAALQARLLR